MKTFILSITALLFTYSAQAADTYHLRCRGGVSHEFQLYAEEYGSWVTMHFQKSSTTYIAPGQCSWDDRPVRADEPSRVCQHQNYPTGRFNISVFVKNEGRAVLLPVTANVKWINKMTNSNSYQSFYVSNNTALKCLDIYAFD